MRYVLSVAALLLLSGCGSTPIPGITPVAPPPSTPAQRLGSVIGLDANALAARLGRPRLQVREGDGTKLQFGGSGCFLDAYLYPPANGGVARVTHVDARNRDGRSVAIADCLRMIEIR